MKYLFSIVLIFCFSLDIFSQNIDPGSGNDQSPNIIFILTDDLGYGDLGFLFQNKRAKEGKPHHNTPNLDSFAAEGVTLTRHYVPAPVCAPSRASLLMGVHQGHAAIRNNQFDKALPDNHTIASVLKRAGYATGLVGKWGLQGLEGESPQTWESYPTKRGFDHFFGYVRHVDGHNHYPAHEARDRPAVELFYGDMEISDKLKGAYTTDLFTAAAKKWIVDQKQNNPDQPFFLELAYDTPHAGLQVASSPYPEGGGLEGGVQWIGKSDNFINTTEESIDDFIHPDYSSQDWPDSQKRFASMVRRIDESIGDIIQLLKDLEIDEETLVVFTSDNGPHRESYGYGDYEPTLFESYGPFDGIKRDTWEGGIRVPTLVRWPGFIPAGTNDSTPTGFHDWMATFAEIAGIPAPARTDGVSLVPILSGEGSTKQGIVYIEYFQDRKTPEFTDFHSMRRGKFRGQMQVIYLDGYKGLRYDIQSPDDEFLIFNTEEDPGEENDLAGSSGYFDSLQQRMKDRVLQVRRPNASAPRPYDDEPVPAVQLNKMPKPGLKFRVFDISTPWTPDPETIMEEVVKEGTSKGFNLKTATIKNPVIEYRGFLKVPASGKYTFTIETGSGAFLRIHEASLIDADKGYTKGNVISSTINLEKGYHPVRLVHSSGENVEEDNSLLQLQWSGPGFSKKEIGFENLFYEE